jgi:hypothetical protein
MKIETPEELAMRLYPCKRHDVEGAKRCPWPGRAEAVANIRARDEQIRAWLEDFIDGIEENEPAHHDIVLDLRDLARRLTSVSPKAASVPPEGMTAKKLP